jgi:hypothetical protein
MDKYVSSSVKNIYGGGKYNSNNEFIKKALQVIKQDDEMLVLACLSELSSQLSMANDNLADDVNCQTLIRELVLLFDKFCMLPDISSKLVYNNLFLT